MEKTKAGRQEVIDRRTATPFPPSRGFTSIGLDDEVSVYSMCDYGPFGRRDILVP